MSSPHQVGELSQWSKVGRSRHWLIIQLKKRLEKETRSTCLKSGGSSPYEEVPVTRHGNDAETPALVGVIRESEDRRLTLLQESPHTVQLRTNSQSLGGHLVRANSSSQTINSSGRIWSELELDALYTLATAAERSPSGRLDWTSIQRDFPNPGRSTMALRSKWRQLKNEWSTPTRLEEDIELPNLGRKREGDITNHPAKRNHVMSSNELQESNETIEQVGADSIRPDEEQRITPSSARLNTLWKEFIEEFEIAILHMDRKPLQKPSSKKVPEETIMMVDGLVQKCMQDAPHDPKVFLRRLNAALYSAVKVVQEAKSRNLRQSSEYLNTLILKRTELMSDITKLTRELSRRNGLIYMRKSWFTYIQVILEKHRVSSTDEIFGKVKYLKDQLSTVQKEIRKETEARKRQRERRLGTQKLLQGTIPLGSHNSDVADIRNYWAEIIGRKDPMTIPEEFEDFTPRREAPTVNHVLDDGTWTKIIRKTPSWKAPGPDGIHAGWWKVIQSAQNCLRQFCSICLEDATHIPNWLCQGNVTLLFKGGETQDPSNFRPIACLNTCYKMLTSMITTFLLREVGSELPAEQLAMKKGVRGCVEAHTLDQCVVKDANLHRKPLCMMWIDMRKAYDSINHDAMIWCLNRWQVTPQLVTIIESLMSKNSLKYTLRKRGGRQVSSPLRVTTGIMQGDTLSPLLFCLAIAPLSHWLRRNVNPYCSESILLMRRGMTSPIMKLSHVFYMDDLKVYTKTNVELVYAYENLGRLAKHLGLTMNPGKCAMKFINCDIPADLPIDVPVLRNKEHYKYLGIEQSSEMHSFEVWKRIEKECLQKVDCIFGSNLTIKQMIVGYNQVVIPKIKFAGNCGIISPGYLSSQLAQAKRIDTEVVKRLWTHRIREKNSCTARIWCTQNAGGLGLRKAEYAVEDAIVETWCYISCRKELEPCFNMARELEIKNRRSITSDFNKVMECYDEVAHRCSTFVSYREVLYHTATKAARAIIKTLNGKRQNKDFSEWMKRTTSARVVLTTLEGSEDERIHPTDSFIWLKSGMIGKKALRMALGAQERTLFTLGSPRNANTNGDCRLGCPFKETEEHIVSGCAAWRSSLMIERHDDICRYLLEWLCKTCGFEQPRKRIDAVTLEGENNIIYFNTPVHIVDQVRYNKPDIVWIQKDRAKAWIIEVSCPWYTRLGLQELRKFNKYMVNGNYPEESNPLTVTNGHSLAKGLRRDRNLEVEFIPIIVGTQGECTSSLRESLKKLVPGDKVTKSLEVVQRKAVLGSNRILQNHLARTQNL